MTALERIQAAWDGQHRGRYTRDDLRGMFDIEMSDVEWAMRQLCLQSHKHFCETIWKLPNGKRVKNDKIHNRMGEFLDEAYEKRIPALVFAPMGLGKTEQGIAWALRLIANDPTDRGGIICDKDNHAWQRVSLVSRYIKGDADFNRLFPEIKIGGGIDARHAFRLSTNKTSKDESLEGSGVLSSGTGTRKDWLIVDDAVTAKNAIHEPAQRERVIVGFEQTWIGRLTPGSWHYAVATVYHSADLWHRLMDKRDEKTGVPVYAYLKIGVSDDFECYDVEERWPGTEAEPEDVRRYEMPLATGMGWTKEAYKAKHDNLVFEGDSSAWYTGYKNCVIDMANRTFHPEWFYKTYEMKPREMYPWVGVYCDPASSDSTESDNMAIWVGAWDSFQKKMVILDGSYTKRTRLSERVDLFLDFVENYSPSVAAVEGKHELSFAQRIQERAVERNMGFRLRKVNHNKDKEMRIEGIQPLMQFGKIWIDAQRFPWIIPEAELFPRARFDDALDALEGLWSLCRIWLRRQGMVGSSFDLSEQYAQDGRGTVPSAGEQGYRVPALDASQSPNAQSRIGNIMFPGWGN